MRKIGISDFSIKPSHYYNLNVIISVGYRVKSHQGENVNKGDAVCAFFALSEYVPKWN